MDGGTQMRESLDQATVERYAEHYTDGVEFPSVVVFYDGQVYWLADGFHRVHAAIAAKLEAINADIRSGDRMAAIRYALSANAANGRPRSNGDMRRAYMVAVENKLCKATDAKAIKELLQCSVQWARRLTQEVRDRAKAERDAKIQKLANEGMTQREIADEVGVAQMTVSNVISEQKGNTFVSIQDSVEIECQEFEPEEVGFPVLADAEPSESVPHVARSSGENEWYTPAKFVVIAAGVMGCIDLDPASSDEAQKIVNAGAYYTISQDGLAKPWFGNVWLNPPYSKDLIGKFVAKLLSHLQDESVPQSIVLINNATETQWFQSLAAQSAAVCFPCGRIQFIDKTGAVANSPLQGQAILYFGVQATKFCRAFSDIGFTAFSSSFARTNAALGLLEGVR
jgi:phage N-6-adenine-methyltransferase